MPPKLILIRHAQALHNATENYDLPDPNLSGTGLLQCLELRSHLQTVLAGQNVGLIVVSPMRRTIQTALLSLDFLLASGVPIVASALWQENSSKPCDTGSPLPALQVEFPMVDFTSLDPVWPDKTSPAGAAYAYNRRAVLERGRTALAELKDREEEAVVVVSHSAFMRQGVTGCWFFNADYRIFEFSGEGLALQQDESTRTGGLGKSFLETVEIGEGIPEEDERVPPTEP